MGNQIIRGQRLDNDTGIHKTICVIFERIFFKLGHLDTLTCYISNPQLLGIMNSLETLKMKLRCSSQKDIQLHIQFQEVHRTAGGQPRDPKFRLHTLDVLSCQGNSDHLMDTEKCFDGHYKTQQ